jgi:predicted ATPase/DNA-binding CsgD family transcriptional regulator
MGAGQSRRRDGNLPSELTGFVGRRQQLSAVKRLLSSARLVTLTGPGGVGKTRLAVQAASDLRRRFSAGAWLVELAEVDHPAHLPQVITAGLGLRDQSDRDPVEVLSEYLRTRQLLLVLDNCEHLATATATISYHVLRCAPELRIIATSRQALGVTGEHLYSIPPLSTPPADADTSLAELTRYESVQLFEERSHAVAPPFAVTESNRSAVTQLCARLDGLPLAIELAAARMRAMTVDQVAACVDDMTTLLASGNQGAQPRQRALSALMGWSYELCAPAERAAWKRAAVFAGTFDVAAANAVCGEPGSSLSEMLDILTGLVDKSVLILSRDSPARYRFLEPIRQFGRSLLEASGEDPLVRRRHCDYFRELAVRAHEQGFGPQQLTWLSRLQQANADVRSALDFSLARSGADAATIAGALRVYWHATGWLSEGRRWLDKVLQVYAPRDRQRAAVLWVHSWLGLMQGRVESALPILEEGRALAEELGDPDLRHDFRLARGVAEMHIGNAALADTMLTSAYQGCKARGDHVGTAIALVQMAILACVRDDADQAAAHAAECVRISERHGESWYQAHGRWVLAIAWWRRGRADAAVAELRTCIRSMRDFEERLVLARSFEVLGWIEASRDCPERAPRLLGMASRLWDDTNASFSAFGRLRFFHDECAWALRDRLGEAAFAQGLRSGAAMSLESAIAFALGEPEKHVPRPGTEAEAAPALITPREREVADLIARGMSNKQIAASLFISLRTVEAHVEHILNKLGFRSRAQIAMWHTAAASEAHQGREAGAVPQ